MLNICCTEVKAVVDAGAVPPLVHMLSSPNDKVVEMGLFVLSTMIGAGGRFRDFVLSQGFLEAFLNVCKQDLPVYLHDAVPFTIRRLFYSGSTPLPFLVARSVVPLVEQELRVATDEVSRSYHNQSLFIFVSIT